jgi:hypothetical protein
MYAIREMDPYSLASFQRCNRLRDSSCRESESDVSHSAECATLGRAELHLGGLSRVKSLFTMDSSNVSMSDYSCSSQESFLSNEEAAEDIPGTRSDGSESDFLLDMKRAIGDSAPPHVVPDFGNISSLRKVMERHLRRARLLREASRGTCTSQPQVAASIASSMGVPYTALRRECPFLFDEYTHPLHTVLAEVLNVPDLSQVHHVDEHELLLPLRDKDRRHAFHAVYDTFVTSFCIPLLHSMALSKRILQQSASDRIVYRYQAFPTIQVSRPGGSALPAPTCDSINGHTLGCLTFFVPLTACHGTNCMFIESHPGKEDWHPLSTKSVGLGYLIDGARCLHFDLKNTTGASRVSLTFRVMIYREGDDTAGLCPADMLDDAFTNASYYDEVVIDLRRSSDSIVKKNGNRLLNPSPRLGHPFA